MNHQFVAIYGAFSGQVSALLDKPPALLSQELKIGLAFVA